MISREREGGYLSKTVQVIPHITNEIKAREAQLDILVNNAAGNFPAPIEELYYNGFKAVVDIDLLGVSTEGPTARLNGRVLLNGSPAEKARISAIAAGEWDEHKNTVTDASGNFTIPGATAPVDVTVTDPRGGATVERTITFST